MVAVLAVTFLRLPTSFLPSEDQGGTQMQYTLPPGATQARTLAAVKAIENYFLTKEAANVRDIFMVLGQAQSGSGQNTGRGFMHLKDWDQRPGKENTAQAITQRAKQALSSLRDVQF